MSTHDNDVVDGELVTTLTTNCKRCQKRKVPLHQAEERGNLCQRCWNGGNTALTQQSDSKPSESSSFADEDQLGQLRTLLALASKPYAPRGKTFSEWLFNEDPNAVEREAREFAGNQAQELMAARSTFFRLTREQAETTRYVLQQRLEAKLDIDRADVERLGLAKMAEQIRGETEELEARRYSKRIEEAMKVKRLLEGAATRERTDQGNPEVEKIRRKYTTKVEAEQAVIEDFRRKLSHVYWSDDLDDEEKALRILSILDIYQLGREALPKEIRRFLERQSRRAS
jgi:hypothetical protein